MGCTSSSPIFLSLSAAGWSQYGLMLCWNRAICCSNMGQLTKFPISWSITGAGGVPSASTSFHSKSHIRGLQHEESPFERLPCDAEHSGRRARKKHEKKCLWRIGEDRRVGSSAIQIRWIGSRLDWVKDRSLARRHHRQCSQT